MLPFKYRLNAKYFPRLYKDGRKFRGELGMLVVKNFNELSNPQFAFVVSKKIGNSVQRHHMTRLLRQITYECINEFNLETNLGCEYIAFKYEDNYENLKKEYREQIKNAFKHS